MSLLLRLCLLLAACDTTAASSCFGRALAAGERCCPNSDPITGWPTGSCSPVGDACQPNATDSACVCADTGWQCHGTFTPRDLTIPDLGD
jgi:hypothetical protein